MTKLDWAKVHRSKILNKEEIIPPFIKDKNSVNAYMGILDAISKIENKEWLRSRKGLKKQERYKNTLYRKLNRHIEELGETNTNFRGTKLYKRASVVYSNKED